MRLPIYGFLTITHLLTSAPSSTTDIDSFAKHGIYKAGFKRQWFFDYGRTYQMQLKDGTEYGKQKAPRPVLMNLWYPASPGSKAKPMLHSAYLDLAKGHPNIQSWLQAFESYNKGIVCQELTGTDATKLKPEQKTAFQEFSDSPTTCFMNAPYAKGSFPLIFYHQGNGSSVEDNSEFCEYLASHGYVVVNSSYLQADGKSFNIDSGTGSAGDISFLIAHLRNSPNVDWKHVGLIGHSGGAHAALKYRAVSGGAVDAIVSLDTTEDYYSLADPRWAFIKHDILPNLDRMTGPIMMVANPHAYFDLADKFAGADRCYFTLKLGHNEFISQGVQRLRMDARLADTSKKPAVVKNLDRVEDGYRRLCDFVRRYFDAKLKGRDGEFEAAKKEYAATPIGGSLPNLELAPRGASAPPEFDITGYGVPTPRQIRPLIAKLGAAKAVEIIKAAHRMSNASPIFDTTFVYSLEYDLLKAKGEVVARAIHAAFTELGVKSADMFVNIAFIGDMIRNYPFAEECLTMLLTLEPDHAEAKKMLEDVRKKMRSAILGSDMLG